MFISFKGIANGLKNGEQKLCQDACDAFLLNNDIGIALVADGHGSKKHFRSGVGANLAVGIAKKAITQFIEISRKEQSTFWDTVNRKNEKKINEYLKQLKGNIIYLWREAVLQDIKENDFTEDEKTICLEQCIHTDDENDLVTIYGSTLLGAVISEEFWFAIQIGDGACMIFNSDGKAELGIQKDERLEFGRTTSLCSDDAFESFKHNFGSSIIGITVASDGVIDSFIPEKYADFNIKIFSNFINYPSSAVAEKKLQDFLPKLSQQGSCDDVSIAGILNITKGKDLFSIPKIEGLCSFDSF